jgi:hypothetical protein
MQMNRSGLQDLLRRGPGLIGRDLAVAFLPGEELVALQTFRFAAL